MPRILATLEIIVNTPDKIYMSEIETAMHKMLEGVKVVDIEDYGLDLEWMD